MDDRIAEIREALTGLFELEYDEDEQEWDAQEVNPRRLWKVREAARTWADLLDSDALIIRRDEIDYEAAAWALHPGVEPKGWSLTELDRNTARRIVDAALASSQGVEP